VSKYIPCPCSSKALYHKCCKIYHDGKLPENALKLMRSRYSAFALKLCDYIIETTHPENPAREENLNSWRREVLAFSTGTRFDFLEINEFIDGDKEAFVTFTANLNQNNEDVSFTERSVFEKVGDRWLYKSGELKQLEDTD
jgi:SEC-C motif-containing protein